jgi:hypothetical protein
MAELEGQHRHAEALAGVVRCNPTERHELPRCEAQRVAKRTQMLVHQFDAEAVVPGSHGGMRREDDLS